MTAKRKPHDRIPSVEKAIPPPPPPPPAPDPLDDWTRWWWGMFAFCVGVLVLGSICAALGLF